MTDTSKIPKLREHRLVSKPSMKRPHNWDGFAYWTSDRNWMQCLAGGRCQWNNDILPPLILLQKRAVEIVGGCFVRFRVGNNWDKLKELSDDMPGELSLTGEINPLFGSIEYSIRFQETGDSENRGSGHGFMLPDFAYAWLIAVTQEHHLEVLDEDLRVGGIA
jgi:hypothetical protein